MPAAQSAQPLETDNPKLRAEVDATTQEWLRATGAPSASIAIVQRGQLVYAKAYGRARLHPDRLATPDTRYAIDSVSKEFTAAAVLMLAEQGKLSLDDPLSRWFPDLGAASQVTVRQILNHTAGIRDFWPQDFVTPQMSHPTTTAAIIDAWARRPLDYEPGTQWQYSNTGYVLAGAIVERISGKNLYRFLDEHIFAPLRMTQVTEDDTAPLPDRDAGAYTRYGLGPVQPAPKEGAGWLFAAAGLAMRPSDLARWDISLMDRSVLSAASYREALTPVILKDGTSQNYALGLEVETIQGRQRIGHDGAGSGFLADNRIWPEERTAIVVLTNNDWASPSDLTGRIAFEVLEPKPHEARARRIFEGFQKGSVDRALFTEVGNFYLTAQVLQDQQASLGPLGPARLIELTRESKRGGMITRRWKILSRGGRLEAVERGYADGKLDQFIVTALGD